MYDQKEISSGVLKGCEYLLKTTYSESTGLKLRLDIFSSGDLIPDEMADQFHSEVKNLLMKYLRSEDDNADCQLISMPRSQILKNDHKATLLEINLP